MDSVRAEDFPEAEAPGHGEKSDERRQRTTDSRKDMKVFRVQETEDHLTETGTAEATRIVPRGTVLYALLPKLLSGEIRVRDAEKLVEKGAP